MENFHPICIFILEEEGRTKEEGDLLYVLCPLLQFPYLSIISPYSLLHTPYSNIKTKPYGKMYSFDLDTSTLASFQLFLIAFTIFCIVFFIFLFLSFNHQ